MCAPLLPAHSRAQQLWSGNCTVGQLTALGASQHYQMGQKLRSIYVDQLKLIGEYFNPDDVYIRSLDGTHYTPLSAYV